MKFSYKEIFFQSFITNNIISFECNNVTLPVLKNNLENNIDNYDIYNFALGEKKDIGNWWCRPHWFLSYKRTSDERC